MKVGTFQFVPQIEIISLIDQLNKPLFTHGYTFTTYNITLNFSQRM